MGAAMQDKSSSADGPDLRQVCRRSVQTLIEKNDWALLTPDELVEWVLGATQPDASPTTIRRLAINHYTVVLYQACRQVKDPDRRERAYYELHRFLYRVAYKHWSELADDAAQRALLLVFEQIDRCREPGAFLAFALYKLRHAFQLERRQRARHDTELPDSGNLENWPTLLDRLRQDESNVAGVAEIESQLEQQQRLHTVLDALQRLPDNRKRQTIYLKFYREWSDEDIGARLGITPNHVRVLRNRGLEWLRKELGRD